MAAGVHVSKLKVKLCGSSYDVEVIPDTFTVKRYIQHKISAASYQVRLLKLALYWIVVVSIQPVLLNLAGLLAAQHYQGWITPIDSY